MTSVIENVRKALASERRLQAPLSTFDIRIDESGSLTLEGEVDSIADKRIALERAAAVKDVGKVIDRVRLRADRPTRNKVIRRHALNMLLNDASFNNLDLYELDYGDRLSPFRLTPERAVGKISVEAEDGVVTLKGAAPSLAHKRLAGVFAWWAPGVRDVVNAISVEPAEEDSPARIEEAVRLALEADPLIDASQIRVGVRLRTVRLTGAAPLREQRAIAERDAWSIFGVEDVINEIKVTP